MSLRFPLKVRIREEERDLAPRLLHGPVLAHRTQQPALRLHQLVDDGNVTAPVVAVVDDKYSADGCGGEVNIVLLLDKKRARMS